MASLRAGDRGSYQLLMEERQVQAEIEERREREREERRAEREERRAQAERDHQLQVLRLQLQHPQPSTSTSGPPENQAPNMCGHGVPKDSLERNKRHAADIARVLSIYGYITDSYIIEFFTDNLWESLPASWRAALSGLSAPELADQLLSPRSSEEGRYKSVWPLSLLALKVTAHSLAFCRTLRYEEVDGPQKRPAEFRDNLCQSSLLDPLFRKHVKPKKQHEIRRLGKLVKNLCTATRCDHVVDIGSGQGHLSRVLTFGFGLDVTAVEADPHLVTMATKFDQDFLYMLKKERLRPSKAAGFEVNHLPSQKPPRHILACVDPQAPSEDFLNQIGPHPEKPSQVVREEKMGDCKTPHKYEERTAGGAMISQGLNNADEAAERPLGGAVSAEHLIKDPRFVVSGLHACGDLSVAMLRHFARCPLVVGITSVACCYMKLSTQEMPQPPGVLSPSSGGLREFGYPMSSWVSGLPGHKLSYKAREVACHAIEDYIERLKGDSDILRTHCYRAILEMVIRRLDPAIKRPGVQTIKRAHMLTFHEYAEQGLRRVGLELDAALDEAWVERMLSQQRNVVVFFSLALLLAPLVETLILLDRMIFLQEQGFHCDVIPLFRPHFSPRNLVLVAAKGSSPSSDLRELLESAAKCDGTRQQEPEEISGSGEDKDQEQWRRQPEPKEISSGEESNKDQVRLVAVLKTTRPRVDQQQWGGQQVLEEISGTEEEDKIQRRSAAVEKATRTRGDQRQWRRQQEPEKISDSGHDDRDQRRSTTVNNNNQKR
ncbi:methyltransferase-like protein 25B [Gastrophryne carolinensis]